MTTPDDGASEVVRRRRRWWSDEDKARIVAECDRPGASVSLVARRHDLNTNLLFSWRRQFRDRQGGAGEVAFVPAVIAPQEPAADRPAAMPREPEPVLASSASPRANRRIEIVLGDSRRIIVDEDVSATALARVIGVLEQR
jgi:transposase